MIARICSAVLSLPPRLAAITPCRITQKRSSGHADLAAEDRRPSPTTAAGRTTRAARAPSRSAPCRRSGRAILPNEVTWPVRRASSPSMKSVTAATRKTSAAHACQPVVAVGRPDPADHHEDRDQEQPAHGQRVGQVPGRGRPSVGTGSVLDVVARHQVDAVGRHDARVHPGAGRGVDTRAGSTTPSTSGPWCAARPTAAPSTCSSTSTRTCSPTRSAARWSTSELDELVARGDDALRPRPRGAGRTAPAASVPSSSE